MAEVLGKRKPILLVPIIKFLRWNEFLKWGVGLADFDVLDLDCEFIIFHTISIRESVWNFKLLINVRKLYVGVLPESDDVFS